VRVEARGLDIDFLCPAEKIHVGSLQLHLSQITLIKSDKKSPSSQIKDHINAHLLGNDWRDKFVFDSRVPTAINNANYRFDAVFDSEVVQDCGHRHRIFLEICFDNRQAIGTNLLKFQAASDLFDTSADRKSLAILICADNRTLKKNSWDSSAASSEEYEFAIRTPYSSIIHKEPLILAFRD
jgi:hypothetical protein